GHTSLVLVGAKKRGNSLGEGWPRRERRVQVTQSRASLRGCFEPNGQFISRGGNRDLQPRLLIAPVPPGELLHRPADALVVASRQLDPNPVFTLDEPWGFSTSRLVRGDRLERPVRVDRAGGPQVWMFQRFELDVSPGHRRSVRQQNLPLDGVGL